MNDPSLVPVTNAAPLSRGVLDDPILRLIQYGMDHGIDVQNMQTLQAMAERADDRRAAAEFAESMARFQNYCPLIRRTARAEIVGRSGGKFSYRYAPLEQIVSTVRGLLHDCGFNYTWDSEETAGNLRVTCRLKHRNGHSETASHSVPIQTSAGMSEQQKVSAALSIARRQSLVQVLGLVMCDPDFDGGEPPGDQGPTIDQSDVAILKQRVQDTGGDIEKFTRHATTKYGVESLSELPASALAPLLADIDRAAKSRTPR